jgi:hypothetical protein
MEEKAQHLPSPWLWPWRFLINLLLSLPAPKGCSFSRTKGAAACQYYNGCCCCCCCCSSSSFQKMMRERSFSLTRFFRKRN